MPHRSTNPSPNCYNTLNYNTLNTCFVLKTNKAMSVQIPSRDRTNNAGPIILSNGATLGPSTCPITEDPHHAMHITSNGQYADIIMHTPWHPSQFTIELWVYADSTTNDEWSAVFASSDIYTVPHSCQIDIHDGIYLFTHNDVSLEIGTVESSWQHLAVTYDGSVLTTYMNGSLAKSVNISLSTTFTYIRVGANRVHTHSFLGKIDEVRVWDHAQHQAKLDSKKSEALVGDEPGLKAYYRFDYHDPATIRDGTGNGYDLKVVGEPERVTAHRPTNDYIANAVHFTGNASYGEATTEEWNTNSFSVVLWASAESTPVNPLTTVFSTSNDPDTPGSFQIHSDGKNYRFHHTNLGLVIGPIQETWQQLAVTYDGQKLCTYLDAVLMNEITVDMSVTFTHYYIGCSRSNDMFFQGKVDEVQVWDHARKPEHLTGKLNYRASAHLGSMKAYWRFGEIAPNSI